MPPQRATDDKGEPKHKNTYSGDASYSGLAVPTASFGSTKGKHVRGNPTTVEVQLSASYVPLRARKLAKARAAAEGAAAGKKEGS
jgi:hypothetical protein